MTMKTATLVLSAAVATATSWGAAAQEPAKAAPALSLELNGAQSSEKGCRLTFVIVNGLGADLAKAAFEVALFNKDGVVDRLTVLDFKDLPSGKTKVTRFDLPGTECSGISRILINNATECAGKGIEPNACMKDLKTDTKARIAFGL
jgi:hypothetical protein